LQVQYKASLSSTAALLSADINNQKLRAMQGDSMGTPAAGAHGVYFTVDSYTLFHGSSYSLSEASNYTVNLEYPLNFSQITLPGSILVFTPGSGEINSYDPANNLVVLTDIQSQSSVTYSFNRYGVSSGSVNY
jgi:hypothetical protein